MFPFALAFIFPVFGMAAMPVPHSYVTVCLAEVLAKIEAVALTTLTTIHKHYLVYIAVWHLFAFV